MSFRFLTAGESHGQALVGVLEGLPAGLDVSEAALHTELKRRKLGFGRGARQAIETDAISLLAGVRLGKTLGSPIAVLMPNKDWPAWQRIMQVAADPGGASEREVAVPRPGHADRVGGIKYDHADMRNVLERSSARETAMRVALGSIARLFCRAMGVHVGSRVVQLGEAAHTSPYLGDVDQLNAVSDASPVRCTDAATAAAMVAAVAAAQAQGDTLGGSFEVLASGLPLGLGSYVQWDRRLEAALGKAFLSLNAIKGVEIGAGFRAAQLPGSQAHDAMVPGAGDRITDYLSNHAGGIEGGMSSGQVLVVRAAMKPLATLQSPLASVHLGTGEAARAHVERSDVCAVPAAAVVGESLVCLVLAEAMLEKFGGDSMTEILPRVVAWRAQRR